MTIHFGNQVVKQGTEIVDLTNSPPQRSSPGLLRSTGRKDYNKSPSSRPRTSTGAGLDTLSRNVLDKISEHDPKPPRNDVQRMPAKVNPQPVLARLSPVKHRTATESRIGVISHRKDAGSARKHLPEKTSELNDNAVTSNVAPARSDSNASSWSLSSQSTSDAQIDTENHQDFPPRLDKIGDQRHTGTEQAEDVNAIGPPFRSSIANNDVSNPRWKALVPVSAGVIGSQASELHDTCNMKMGTSPSTKQRHKTPVPGSAPRHRRSCNTDDIEQSMARLKFNIPLSLRHSSQHRSVTEISPRLYELNLRGHLNQMQTDQSYFIVAQLRQAEEGLVNPPRVSLLTKSRFGPGDDSEDNSHSPSVMGRLGHWIKGTNERNNESLRYKQTLLEQEKHPLPPYTAYISARRNILTEDDKQRACLPYLGDDFADCDDEYRALEDKIEQNQERNHRVNTNIEQARMQQRYAERFLADIGCKPEALFYYLFNENISVQPSALPKDCTSYWYLRTNYLTDGYYEDEDDSDALEREDTPYQGKPLQKWQHVFEQLPSISEQDLAIACVACKIYHDVAKLSLFYIAQTFIKETESIQGQYSLGTYAELGCFICKVHECPGHGEYKDVDDDKNVRERVNFKLELPESDVAQAHQLNTDDMADFLGLQDDGEVVGRPWTKLLPGADHGLHDMELCSEDCFWAKQARVVKLSQWTQQDVDIFNMLRPAFENERRGACQMARCKLLSKTCKEIFLKLLLSSPHPTQYPIRIRNELEAKDRIQPPKKSVDQWCNDPQLKRSWKQDAREPFFPCDHLGPCSRDTNCTCFEEGVPCEKSCACSTLCTRRFQGCRCHVRGRVCRSETCDCRRLNRECDADLCITCGAVEVLDPSNRNNQEIIASRCANVSIQRGVPKMTLLGPSKLLADGGVSGWGLYMGEECKKGDFVGEYRGEIITGQEADQRGRVYDKRNMSYLFDLNGVQVLDSTRVGNKLRYMNHQADPMSNCFARLLLCNSVVRIGIFALQDIAIGQEIFFDYGEGFATKFDLIKMNPDGTVTVERHEKPSKPKEAFKRRTVESRPLQYQLKNKINKNGLRIGRPPKRGKRLAALSSSIEVTRLSLARRGGSTPSESQSVVSTVLPAETIEHEEGHPRKRLRRASPEPETNDTETRTGRTTRRTGLGSTQLYRLTSRSRDSTPSQRLWSEASSRAEPGMTTRGMSRMTNQQTQSPIATPTSGRFSTVDRNSTAETELSGDDLEGITPRRSSRRRTEKQHFEALLTSTPRTSHTPTPTRLRQSARKENG